jgi:diguanylate cyclase
MSTPLERLRQTLLDAQKGLPTLSPQATAELKPSPAVALRNLLAERLAQQQAAATLLPPEPPPPPDAATLTALHEAKPPEAAPQLPAAVQPPPAARPAPARPPARTARPGKDEQPETGLRPVAELLLGTVNLLTAGAAGLALGAAPGLLTLPGAFGLPLLQALSFGIAAQAGLSLRRWRKGLAAIAEVENRAKRRGITDPLTGLANRAGYKLHVEEALAQRRGREPLGILYIDLDRFKDVNDNYGHDMGDKLLCAVTARLADISGARAIGARLGGDEFALAVTGCGTDDEISAIGESISKRMGQPFMIDGVELVIGGSVGIAIAPTDGNDFNELVRRADISMYRAKSAGRGTCIRFDSSMEDHVRSKKVMEDELRHAIQRNELEMVYQPYFAADGETIRGVEALVRWHSAKLGNISPADFIPLAEETGLIGEIGEWTVRVALEHARSWPDIGLAVNVSPAQFRANGLAESLIGMVHASGIEPRRVEIEVTEGVLIRDADKAAATIKQIRDAGMRVALDDFGTGFASLSYLRRFQFDKLKIDQVFVKTLSSERGGGSGSAAIIHNVVSLGRSLGMTVQAEGVETLEHHIFLRAAGCHCLQGYYFARPMSKTAFDAFLLQKKGFTGRDGGAYDRNIAFG